VERLVFRCEVVVVSLGRICGSAPEVERLTPLVAGGGEATGLAVAETSAGCTGASSGRTAYRLERLV